jgi:hypothetical protein
MEAIQSMNKLKLQAHIAGRRLKLKDMVKSAFSKINKAHFEGQAQVLCELEKRITAGEFDTPIDPKIDEVITKLKIRKQATKTQKLMGV